MPKTVPTQLISVRLPIELVYFLDRAAADESRNRTQQLTHFLREVARMRGCDLEALARSLAEDAERREDKA